jgi:hypothetical protein
MFLKLASLLARRFISPAVQKAALLADRENVKKKFDTKAIFLTV